jgi:small basic protein
MCNNDAYLLLMIVLTLWCDAILGAVFKKGDPSVYDNYHGIAVGALMGKLY